jgi:CDP-glucose 4,6-dehydratase
MQLAREFMDAAGRAFEGKRVLVTGHTGFKGSWLCEWLISLGADVGGFSLSPPPQAALFEELGLAQKMHHRIGDVRNPVGVREAVAESQPDFVFHLAAQPLVRLSYRQPLETSATNIMGTLHLLSALQETTKPCAVVVVTTDKCYENHEQGRSYCETDALGGHDPYSASKAAAEIMVGAFRNALFSPKKVADGAAPPVAVATARAGNVIGGGDWALDRLVPDCVRALEQGKPILVRNPSSVRPWQHVLEPLGGYLLLASRLYAALTIEPGRLAPLSGAFNFGPAQADHRTVRELVEEILKHWPGRWEDRSDAHAVHEAQLLHLATAKARQYLGWQPRWNFSETIANTVAWYRAPAAQQNSVIRQQISSYSTALVA